MSVYWKRGTLYLRFRDAKGVRRAIATELHMEPDARLANPKAAKKMEEEGRKQLPKLKDVVRAEREELEQAAIEAAKPKEQTFAELFEWYLKEYGAQLGSEETAESLVRVHVLPTMGALPLSAVTTDALESLFNSKLKTPKQPKAPLAPASINRLRGVVVRVFNVAKRRHKVAANVAEETPSFAVTKKLKQILAIDEVGPTLRAAKSHAGEIACGVYLALRKGEVLGALKTAVNTETWEIEVTRSYETVFTKGGGQDVLPIPTGLRPYLLAALKTPGPYLFPTKTGKMQGSKTKLDLRVRSAMRSAGVGVKAWDHKCRRKGCGFVLRLPAKDDTLTCTKVRDGQECGFKLQAVPVVRHVGFHSLRHTCATLLIEMGEPIEVVSKILRHAKLDLTLNTYTQVSVKTKAKSLERLDFGRPIRVATRVASGAGIVGTAGAADSVASTESLENSAFLELAETADASDDGRASLTRKRSPVRNRAGLPLEPPESKANGKIQGVHRSPSDQSGSHPVATFPGHSVRVKVVRGARVPKPRKRSGAIRIRSTRPAEQRMRVYSHPRLHRRPWPRPWGERCHVTTGQGAR